MTGGDWSVFVAYLREATSPVIASTTTILRYVYVLRIV